MPQQLRYRGKGYKASDFYRQFGRSRALPAGKATTCPYNRLVQEELASLGFVVVSELTMPEWGVADLLAVRGSEYILGECKSEKDRDYMKAIGQVITYSNQLREVGYPISRAVIFARNEPTRKRILAEVDWLSQHLPYSVEYIQISNKTRLTSI